MIDEELELLGDAVTQDVVRPFLSTHFSDYTVMEGLLLLLFLAVVVYVIVSLIREGFYWLR